MYLYMYGVIDKLSVGNICMLMNVCTGMHVIT